MTLYEFLVTRASPASHIFMCACSSNSVRVLDGRSSVSTPWLARALPCGSRATEWPIGADALHIADADTRARPPPTAHRGLCPRARHSHVRPPRAPAAIAGTRAKPSPSAHRSPCPRARHMHGRPPRAAVARTRARPPSSRDATRPLPPCAAVARAADSGTDSSG